MMISRHIHVKRPYEFINTDFQIAVTLLDIMADTHVKTSGVAFTQLSLTLHYSRRIFY